MSRSHWRRSSQAFRRTLPAPPRWLWVLVFALALIAAARVGASMGPRLTGVRQNSRGGVTATASTSLTAEVEGTADASRVLRAFAVAERRHVGDVSSVPRGDVVTLRRAIAARLVESSGMPPALVALASDARVCALCAEQLGAPLRDFLLSSGRPNQAEGRVFTCSLARLQRLRLSVVAALRASDRRTGFLHGAGAAAFRRGTASDYSLALVASEPCEYACLATLVAPLTKHSIAQRARITAAMKLDGHAPLSY